MTEQHQQVVFRRKGSRVIYPFTEDNAKNANLIPMTVAEAQEEGLLAPRVETREDPILIQLREQNEKMAAEIKTLKEASSQPATKKKRAVKKPAMVESEPAEEGEQLSLSDLLNK